MRIISWNVNGIRAALKKGFLEFLDADKPDILMLQEIKINDAARAKENFDFRNYEEFWHPAQRPGYSGTAILIKSSLAAGCPTAKLGVGHQSGMGVEKFDKEGRVQALELEKFYLINAYFPNINHEHSRMDYRLEFNRAILDYIKKLAKKKPVIIGGDFNVAREEIDLANPKENMDNAGFTKEERQGMDEFIKSGLIDTYRLVNGDKIQYSWWTYRFAARLRNIGWRIDYLLASKKLANHIKKAFILDEVIGSDHCPVGIEVES